MRRVHTACIFLYPLAYKGIPRVHPCGLLTRFSPARSLLSRHLRLTKVQTSSPAASAMFLCTRQRSRLGPAVADAVIVARISITAQSSTPRTGLAPQTCVPDGDAQLFSHALRRDDGSGAVFRAKAPVDVCGDFGIGGVAARTAQSTPETLKWPIP